MTSAERNAVLSRLGAELPGRDLACYADFDKNPDEPILGEGDPSARICIFGRDPGRHEVEHGVPFVGAGGQKVRGALHRALFGQSPPDFEASLRAGRFVFWANMVPFKPVDNKAWPPAVIRQFRPYIAELLVNGWHGTDVVTLGEGAFKWFGLGDKEDTARLLSHWKRDDRFTNSLEIALSAEDPATGRPTRKTLRLHPLPHPSPLNATWAPRFPGLLDARLRDLRLDRAHWRMGDA